MRESWSAIVLERAQQRIGFCAELRFRIQQKFADCRNFAAGAVTVHVVTGGIESRSDAEHLVKAVLWFVVNDERFSDVHERVPTHHGRFQSTERCGIETTTAVDEAIGRAIAVDGATLNRCLRYAVVKA